MCKGVKKGDRIAQMIFEKICHPTITVLGDDMNLDDTERKGGFGSTGLK